MGDDDEVEVVADEDGIHLTDNETGAEYYIKEGEELCEGCGDDVVYEIELDEIASVDVFLTIRSLMIVGWLSDRPELPIYEHFPLVIRNAEQAAEKVLVS
mgnify:CR=1 FL=1